MKRIAAILSFIVVSLIGLTLTGCNLNKKTSATTKKATTAEATTVKEQTTQAPATTQAPTTTAEEAAEIETVLSTYSNNQEAYIKGIVYGVTKNGYYVADSKIGRIYVVKASSIELPAIGDEVSIKGKFSYVSNFPQIKSVTEQTVISKGNDSPVEELEMTVQEIKGLNSASKTGSYAAYVKVVGSITKDEAQRYVLKDDEGNSIFLESYSDEETLQDNMDKRVTINVVTYKLQEGVWSVSYCSGFPIVETKITFSSLVENAKEEIEAKMPKNVCGAIVLPTEHETITGLTYNWSVETNAAVSVSNNKATFTFANESDVQVKFTATVTSASYEGESATVDVMVTVKALSVQSVSQLKANLPEVENSVVQVEGVITAITHNQSGNQSSLVLIDKATGDTITAEFFIADDMEMGYVLSSSEVFKALAIGDDVTVRGQYVTATRQFIQNIDTLTVNAKNVEFSRFYENALVLNDQASYDELRTNINKYSGKLVKFELPYAKYSVSGADKLVSTSWVRLGYASDAVDATAGNRNIALLISANSDSLSTTIWHTILDLPYQAEYGKQLSFSIYAYCTYISDTYIQFIIADTDCFVGNDEYRYTVELANAIPAAVESGKIELPETTADGTKLTWTSSNTAVIANDGTITMVDKDTIVELTASFGEGKEIKYSVTVQGSNPVSVSELLANGEDGALVKVSGVVIGFASDGNSSESNKGVIVMDPTTKELLVVKGVFMGGECTYPNYKDASGNDIAVGSVVTLVGKYAKANANISVEEGTVNVTSTATVELGDAAYVASNQAELAAIFETATPFAKLIKIVGTNENPIYFVSSSGSAATWNYRIHMIPTAGAAADIKFGHKTLPLSIKSDVNEANAGSEWWTNYEIGQSITYTGYSFVGEMYIVVTYQTSAYYQASIVNYSNWTLVPSKARVDAMIKSEIKVTSVESFEEIVLPASNKFAGEITWTSSDTSIIDLANKTVSRTSEDQEVTLYGTYSNGGTNVTVEVKFTVKGEVKAPALTVAEVVALTDAKDVEFTGVVIAFAHDGNTNAAREGLVVADPVTGNTVVVNGFEEGTYPTYATTDEAKATIKIGDTVLVTGKYSINADIAASTVMSNYVDVETIVVTASDTAVDYSKLTSVVTVTNSAELTAALSGNYYSTIIKIVGSEANPIAIGGSSSDTAKCNFKIAYNDKNNTTDAGKYNSKNISIKSTTPSFVASDWYKTYFPGVTGGFVAMSAKAVSTNIYTGTMYLLITHTTASYYQATLINAAGWSLAAVTAE